MGGQSAMPVSCEPLSCPGLGTCRLEQEGEACKRICQFDETYSIETAEDLERLAALQCEIIDGSLLVSTTSEAVNLQGLESVREITNALLFDGVASLRGLSALERVGCYLKFSSLGFSQLVLELPALRSIGKSLTANGTQSLVSLSLPSLRDVGREAGGSVPSRCDSIDLSRGIWIQANAALESVNLPALVQVNGDLIVGQSPQLGKLCLPSLSEAKDVTIDDTAIPTCVTDRFERDLGDGEHCLTADTPCP